MLDQNNQKNLNYFLITTFTILIFGIIMVYSSSYIYARENFGSSYYFILRQFAYLLIGSSLAFVFSKSKFSFWYKNTYYINGFVTFLLLLTFIPGVGLSLKGSNRWISLGLFSFQPSEIIKYTILLTSIKFFNDFSSKPKNDNILFSLNLAAPLLLLAIQPDFGSFMICLTIIMFSCFLSDFPRKYFYSFLGIGLIGAVTLLISAPYRVKRLLTFLDPWSDPRNSGFQIIQSYLAFGNGSVTGVGLGNSNEKFFLPEAYNDFIFSVVGEELGFIGVFIVVVLFLLFTLFGFRLAVSQFKKINKTFITSIVFIISLQAFLNMGVVLGLLPTKGLNLPFISYGGTSLVANILAIGVLVSALKDGSEDEQETSYQSENKSTFNFQG